MGLDPNKIPTKRITFDEKTVAHLKTRKSAGLVLVEMFNQVSVVMEFETVKEAREFFKQFKGE